METAAFKKASVFWWAGVFLLLVVADQVVKHFARHIFKNAAFAFSIPLSVGFIYIMYAVVLLAMVVYFTSNYQKFSLVQQWAWLLIFAGAMSNIIERLLLGYVRDFIYIYFYKWVGIYNLADFYILAGILILLFIPHRKIYDS